MNRECTHDSVAIVAIAAMAISAIAIVAVLHVPQTTHEPSHQGMISTKQDKAAELNANRLYSPRDQAGEQALQTNKKEIHDSMIERMKGMNNQAQELAGRSRLQQYPQKPSLNTPHTD